MVYFLIIGVLNCKVGGKKSLLKRELILIWAFYLCLLIALPLNKP